MMLLLIYFFGNIKKKNIIKKEAFPKKYSPIVSISSNLQIFDEI